MFYFIISLLVILPIICHFLSIVYNKKIYPHYFLLAFLVPFVLFSNSVIPFLKIGFESFQIALYVILSISIFIGISWTVYKFIITKAYKSNYKSGLIMPSIISVSLILFLVFSLIINLTLDIDITFSINVSNNFKNSIISSENMQNIPLHAAYSTAAYLFVFPSLFPDDIIKCYSLLLPMINVFFMFSIGYYISTNYIKKYNILYSSLISIIILTSFFILPKEFQLPWISLMGAMTIVLMECKKINPLKLYIYVIGFSFLTSSTYLFFLPIFGGLFLYLLLFKKWKEAIVFIPILFYLVFYNAYISFWNYEIIHLFDIMYLIFLLIFFISTICVFFWYFINLKNRNNFDYEYSNYNSKIMNTKNNKYIISLMFLETLFFMISICLIEGYTIVITSIIVCLIVTILMIYLYFNAAMTNNIYQKNVICMSFIIFFITSLEYIIFKSIHNFNEYHLVGRLVLIFNGLLNYSYLTPSSTVYVIFLTTFIIKMADINWWHKITNFNLKNFNLYDWLVSIKSKLNKGITIKYCLASSSILLLSYVPIVSYINEKPYGVFNYKLSTTFNYGFLNNDEVKFLNNIDFKEFNKTYIADFTAGPYLNKAIDITSFMNYGIANDSWVRTQYWQTSGFYSGLKSWHATYRGEKLSDNIDESVSQMVLSTVNLINSSKLFYNNVKTKKQFNSVDYIFLSKNPEWPHYYNSVAKILENYYKTFYNSENLLCLERII